MSATASSGLAVSFGVGATDQCTISGNTVTITGAGSCTVTASQAGNSNYNAAPNAQRTFSIAQATATLTLSNLSQTYDGSPKAVAELIEAAARSGDRRLAERALLRLTETTRPSGTDCGARRRPG